MYTICLIFTRTDIVKGVKPSFGLSVINCIYVLYSDRHTPPTYGYFYTRIKYKEILTDYYILLIVLKYTLLFRTDIIYNHILSRFIIRCRNRLLSIFLLTKHLIWHCNYRIICLGIVNRYEM